MYLFLSYLYISILYIYISYLYHIYIYLSIYQYGDAVHKDRLIQIPIPDGKALLVFGMYLSIYLIISVSNYLCI
jgi:hypothetical protein